MKRIYLIKRTDGCNYDEYDEVVVIAKTPKEAKKWILDDGNNYWGMFKDNIICKLIGVANKTQPFGEVCSSFNAG